MKRWHPGEDVGPWARRMRKRLGDILSQQRKLESERHEIINALWGLPQPIFSAEFSPETFCPWRDDSAAEINWQRFHPMLTTAESTPQAVSRVCVTGGPSQGASSSNAPPPSVDARAILPSNTESSNDAPPRSFDRIPAVPPNEGPTDNVFSRSADILPAVSSNAGLSNNAPPRSANEVLAGPPNARSSNDLPPFGTDTHPVLTLSTGLSIDTPPSADTRPVLPPNAPSSNDAPTPSADTRPLLTLNTGSSNDAPPHSVDTPLVLQPNLDPSADMLPKTSLGTRSFNDALPSRAGTQNFSAPDTRSSDFAPVSNAHTRIDVPSLMKSTDDAQALRSVDALPAVPRNTASSYDTLPALPPHTRLLDNAPPPRAKAPPAAHLNTGSSVDAPAPRSDMPSAIQSNTRSFDDVPMQSANALLFVPPHPVLSDDAGLPTAGALPSAPPDPTSSDDAAPPAACTIPASMANARSFDNAPIRTAALLTTLLGNTKSFDNVSPPATAGPSPPDSPRSSSSSSSSILVPIRTEHPPNAPAQCSAAAVEPTQKCLSTTMMEPFRTPPSRQTWDAELSELTAPLVVDSSDDEPIVTPRTHALPAVSARSPNRTGASSFIGSQAPYVHATSLRSPLTAQSPAPSSVPEAPARPNPKETSVPITTSLPNLSLEFFQALDSDGIKQWMRYFGMKSNSGESFMRNRLAENCKYLQTGVMPAKQSRVPEKRRKNDGAEREILCAIRQTSFFEEILTFSPIDLNELQAHLREADTRIDLKSLRELLEAKGVTIKMAPK